MTRATKAAFAGALLCGLLGLTLISLYFDWPTWAATPHGKNTITWVTFVALAGWLISVAVRDARRKRLSQEAQEWDANTEWFDRIHEQAPVRRVTRADMDREDERLTTTVVAAVPEWPQPQSPRLTDWAVSAAAPAPLPPRYWLGDPKPIAEMESLTGAAAWFANDMRTGVDVVEAPVSPAAGPVYKPRHKSELVGQGVITGTQTQRWQWENEETGSWPVVRELVGAGA